MDEHVNAYPDDTPILVRFPLAGGQDRELWPWLPGRIIQQCGPDEWDVCVEAPELENADGFPLCFRDSSEIRPAS